MDVVAVLTPPTLPRRALPSPRSRRASRCCARSRSRSAVEEASRDLRRGGRAPGSSAPPGLMSRALRVVQRARRAVADGAIGDVVALRTRATPTAWRTRRSATGRGGGDRDTGGGALQEKLVHHIDLWRYITGLEVEEAPVRAGRLGARAGRGGGRHRAADGRRAGLVDGARPLGGDQRVPGLRLPRAHRARPLPRRRLPPRGSQPGVRGAGRAPAPRRGGCGEGALGRRAAAAAAASSRTPMCASGRRSATARRWRRSRTACGPPRYWRWPGDARDVGGAGDRRDGDGRGGDRGLPPPDDRRPDRAGARRTARTPPIPDDLGAGFAALHRDPGGGPVRHLRRAGRVRARGDRARGGDRRDPLHARARTAASACWPASTTPTWRSSGSRVLCANPETTLAQAAHLLDYGPWAQGPARRRARTCPPTTWRSGATSCWSSATGWRPALDVNTGLNDALPGAGQDAVVRAGGALAAPQRLAARGRG